MDYSLNLKIILIVLLLFSIVHGKVAKRGKTTNTKSKSIPDRKNVIFGGTEVKIRDYGYQLQFNVNGRTLCGACMISSTWALTAAHCTAAYSKGITLLGGSAVIGKGTPIPVTKVVQHPAYNPDTFINDISCLNYKAVVITEDLYPIKMAAAGSTLPVGSPCVVSGYGLTEKGVQPPNLLGTPITVSDQASCIKNYATVGLAVTPNMICVGSLTGKDSCSGDSVSSQI